MMRSFRLLLCLPLALATLAGCSLLGEDDYADLAPGTFRFRADGKTYSGTARFYRQSGFANNAPVVHLLSSDSISLYIISHDLLRSGRGSNIEGRASFYPYGSVYSRDSGYATIKDTSDGGRSGVFDYYMKDVSIATLNNRILRVRGGFNAVSAND